MCLYMHPYYASMYHENKRLEIELSHVLRR